MREPPGEGDRVVVSFSVVLALLGAIASLPLLMYFGTLWALLPAMVGLVWMAVERLMGDAHITFVEDHTTEDDG